VTLSVLACLMACGVAVAALLLAERGRFGPGRVVFKLSASTAFVALALMLGAVNSFYGQCILAALLLGWLGDALLLSDQPAMFLGGLGAFLLSHLAFAVAFATSVHFALSGAMWALIPALLVGAVILRWLWPHLTSDFKGPVIAYVVVILAMCAAAFGFVAGGGHWLAPVGAVLCAASDIAGARDRFVQSAFVNRAWGLPAYFVAQLCLAATVAYTA